MEYYDRMFITKANMVETDNVPGCCLHSLTLGNNLEEVKITRVMVILQKTKYYYNTQGL